MLGDILVLSFSPEKLTRNMGIVYDRHRELQVSAKVLSPLAPATGRASQVGCRSFDLRVPRNQERATLQVDQCLVVLQTDVVVQQGFVETKSGIMQDMHIQHVHDSAFALFECATTVVVKP